MKKIPLSFLCMLTVSPLLVQCASQDEINQINYQLRTLNNKVSTIENTSIDDLRKRHAATASQIESLQQDFLQLKSELEEAGHLNRRLNEQSKELETAFKTYTKQEQEKRAAEINQLSKEITDKDQQLEQLAEQIRTQQEHLKTIQQARVEEAKRQAAEAARKAEEARQKAAAANQAAQGPTITRIPADKTKRLYSASAAPAATTPAAETASSPPVSTTETSSRSDYKGKSLFDQGKYREAYQVFEKIASSGGNDQAALDAKYMMGECLFGLKEYDQAILEYQSIITNYPSSAKAPGAMLRQAMAFENLNDKDTAKILYKKIIASYSQSPEAGQAQKKLDTL